MVKDRFMDGTRFDDIAKLMTIGGSRRGAFAAFLAGIVLAVQNGGEAKKKRK